MAFVNGPITITYTFQDDDLAQSSVALKFPPVTSLPSVLIAATNFAALLDPVSDCALRSYSVTSEVYDDTYPVGASGSDVEDKGVMTIRTANNGTSRFSWPGVMESILVNNITPPGTYIDLQNVAVAALVSALINGITAGLGQSVEPSDKRGLDFLSIKEAYKQNRASLKSREYKG